MINEWVYLFSVVGGSLVTGLTAFGINWINKRSEERKHFKSLVVNAAIKNWENNIPIAKEQKGVLLPLGVFIMNTVKTFDLLLDKKINKEDIALKLKELDEFGDVGEKYFRNKGESITKS